MCVYIHVNLNQYKALTETLSVQRWDTFQRLFDLGMPAWRGTDATVLEQTLSTKLCTHVYFYGTNNHLQVLIVNRDIIIITQRTK